MVIKDTRKDFNRNKGKITHKKRSGKKNYRYRLRFRLKMPILFWVLGQNIQKKCDQFKASQRRRNKIFDKVSYQFDSAVEDYCKRNQVEKARLSNYEKRLIQRYAGNHIGFFLTWIIKNDLEGKNCLKFAKALEMVKKEQLLGIDFLIECMEGIFCGGDVSEEIFVFVDQYYESIFLDDYSKWVIRDLRDVPLEFIGTWEDYHGFEKRIDQAYDNFKKGKLI